MDAQTVSIKNTDGKAGRTTGRSLYWLAALIVASTTVGVTIYRGARWRSFDAYVNKYIGVANDISSSAGQDAYIKGRVIVIKQRLDVRRYGATRGLPGEVGFVNQISNISTNLSGRLPDDMQARQPQEVGTVVIVGTGMAPALHSVDVGTWKNTSNANDVYLTIVDYTIPAIIAHKYMGSDPTDASIITYLVRLPRRSI